MIGLGALGLSWGSWALGVLGASWAGSEALLGDPGALQGWVPGLPEALALGLPAGIANRIIFANGISEWYL